VDRVLRIDVFVPDQLSGIFRYEAIDLADDDPTVSEKGFDFLGLRGGDLFVAFQLQTSAIVSADVTRTTLPASAASRIGLQSGALSGSALSHPRNVTESQ
jgi:hypothetical protein